MAGDKTSTPFASLERSPEFAENPRLNMLLAELARQLGPVDALASANLQAPKFPPLMVLGNPRSGTTLLMSLLQQSGGFAVPTNVLARFAYAPYLGSLIQQLLFNPEFDYRGQLGGAAGGEGGHSVLGSTRGPLNVNEFYHFWRRFFPAGDIAELDAGALQAVDIEGLLRGIAAIESVFIQPVALKALMLQFNLSHFQALLPPVFYVYIRRDPVDVMCSILRARMRYYGDERQWWSVKPAQYEHLRHLCVEEQIAGQVYYTERAIRSGLRVVPENLQLVVDYESICRAPADVIAELRRSYRELDVTLETPGQLPERLAVSHSEDVPVEMRERLREAYSRLDLES
ncbi:sulfotransferase family protein [Mangrovimicrobium sediminis]|uniref:Sulfotransferase family protein n=1 Tax=Mangrovimicrobium sediminis TaxID=2562682 RepID=A0A4Z0M7N2_9GAMM|nr:sulfotransferase domain-containing protein [Haliea sp. SAOS-164]TGD75663.1 sulfotransferase family protein [Haliea sp. SAOS-164]